MEEKELSFRSQFMKLATAAKVNRQMAIRVLNSLLRYREGPIETMEDAEDLYNRIEVINDKHIRVRKKEDPNQYTWPPRAFGPKSYDILGIIVQEWKDEKADVANDIPEETYTPKHAKQEDKTVNQLTKEIMFSDDKEKSKNAITSMMTISSLELENARLKKENAELKAARPETRLSAPLLADGLVKSILGDEYGISMIKVEHSTYIDPDDQPNVNDLFTVSDAGWVRIRFVKNGEND